MEHNEGPFAHRSHFPRDFRSQVVQTIEESLGINRISCSVGGINFRQGNGNHANHRSGIHWIEPEMQVESGILLIFVCDCIFAGMLLDFMMFMIVISTMAASLFAV